MSQVERQETSSVHIGTVVGGKFALIAEIGAGATGIVFEAEDTWLGRRVALKVLHPHVAENPDTVRLIRREARAAARINHPNIVAVHEVGQRHDGSYYLVQELLQGVSLREHLTVRGRFKPIDALDVVVPIMGALAAAHEVGIVHRDLKPDNIFLARTSQGEVTPKLIDFGIAQVSAPKPGTRGPFDTLTPADRDRVWGTPCYMAPEQVQGREVTAQTDVWAMGVVLFELLVGLCPFEGATVMAVFSKLMNEPVPRLDAMLPGVQGVPEALAAIVDRALRRSTSERYRTIHDMLRALCDFADTEDSGFRARHARSIPRSDEHDSIDVQIVDEDPRTSLIEQPGARVLDIDWSETTAKETQADTRCMESAQQALRINALREALSDAERALTVLRVKGEDAGRMRLVQVIAHLWLGNHPDAERCAVAAMNDLPRGGTGWYAAAGHLAMAYGYQGKNQDLLRVVAETEAQMSGDRGPSRAIACSRCALMLVRAGEIEAAERMLGSARALAVGRDVEPVEQAWIDIVVAELASLAGDLFEYLTLLRSASASFAEAGDVRNACLQRANLGNAYMQLGAYTMAAQIFSDTLAVVEPMKLAFIAVARTNLGLCLSRLGDLERAYVEETKALEENIRQGSRRIEAVSRIYLAEIAERRGDGKGAEVLLRAALATAEPYPPVRAYALAAMAKLLLGERNVPKAYALAKEAMDLLEDLDGVEEGESLIRLVHAQVLDATRRHRSANAHLAAARQRIMERARRVTDVDLRRSFLESIPENRATLDMAKRLD